MDGQCQMSPPVPLALHEPVKQELINVDEVAATVKERTPQSYKARNGTAWTIAGCVRKKVLVIKNNL